MSGLDLSEDEEICGETFDHELEKMGEGYWICRRCEAEIIEEDEAAAPEPGEPGGEA